MLPKKSYFTLLALLNIDSNVEARGAVKNVPELYAREGEQVWYTALNDVAVIDFRAKQLNFHDFTQESADLAGIGMD